jgi:uncharacterized protein Yka (UPF0111/DUF47 family)
MGLTPKDAVLFDLYTSLAERLAAASRALEALIKAPQAERLAISGQVAALESEADELLVLLVTRIDDMFVTPYDRGDLQQLANALDDSIDAMEAASDLTVLHNVDSFPAGTDEIADAVRRLAELTASNMPRLKNLKDLDFYYTEANRIEDDGDRMHRRMTAKLFDGSYKAMEVLRIQGVFEKMEESLDRMAAVARIVRTISLKES